MMETPQIRMPALISVETPVAVMDRFGRAMKNAMMGTVTTLMPASMRARLLAAEMVLHAWIYPKVMKAMRPAMMATVIRTMPV